MKRNVLMNILILLSMLIGIGTGFLHNPLLFNIAEHTSILFMRLLKLIGLPIIFLSLVSSLSSMEGMKEMKTLGRRILCYTLLTTVIAAFIALILFLAIKPVKIIETGSGAINELTKGEGYLTFLMNIIPENIFQAFTENNIISVAFLGVLFGISILSLPGEKKKVLHSFFSSLFAMILKVTNIIILLIPLAIWAFVTLFFKDFHANSDNLYRFLFYFLCVIGANVIQGIIILPLLLKWKKTSPLFVVKGMYPALLTAFFTKSSNAALPLGIKCAKDRLKLSPRVTNVTLPLCSVINMNGCAAFILITVLFVSMSHGMAFSYFEMFFWVILSTLAAVGNAGVPMGCFFLASSFLSGMNVPLQLMGLILPLYAVIDMVETALNVWSDSCVAVMVDKDLQNKKVELKCPDMQATPDIS